jgi:hypothetical protein
MDYSTNISRKPRVGEFPFMQAKNIPTWEINPLLPWGCPFLQAEQKRDEDKFWTEYGARFRGNKSSLLGF